MRLADIAPIHIEKLLQTKSTMSAKSQRNILVLLQSIFSVAVDNDLISGSPVRKRHKPKCPRLAKAAWTPEQVRKIVDAVPAEHKPLFICIALTGLRLGELLALRWKNVDFLGDTIHIERSLWGGELQTPKTDASVSTVPMKSVLKSALTQLRQRGDHTELDSFVFCKSDGAPLHPDVLRKDVLYPVLDRLGIPRQRRASGFHAFRHAAATTVQSTTKDMLAAQKLLRHASYSTTADIYVHGGDAAQNEAAEALEAAIFPELFQIVPNRGTSTGSEQ
jgi:integrase